MDKSTIHIPVYFHNWLLINDFHFVRKSIKQGIVLFESKTHKCSFNIARLCCIELKGDDDMSIMFYVPRDRNKFYQMTEWIGKTLGITVTQDVA